MNEENHGAVFEAMSVARFGAEDEARAKWLDEQIRREDTGIDATPMRFRDVCRLGHKIDGVKMQRGKLVRYCRRCNAETTRKARANKAGTSPAMEGANG